MYVCMYVRMYLGRYVCRPDVYVCAPVSATLFEPAYNKRCMKIVPVEPAQKPSFLASYSQ